MQPLTETNCTPAQRARQLLRRYHKPLLALLLLAAYLPLRYFAAEHAAAGLAGEEARNAAAQISNQWVGFWGPAAKLVWTLIFYWASGFTTFKGLATTPVLPDWATGKYSKEGGEFRPVLDYKAAFLSLTDAQRLQRYENAAWKEMVRFSICLVAACLLA